MNNVPLDQPLYGATFPQAISRFFQKYAVFSGRASRSEFWYAYLFVFLVNVFISTVFGSLIGDMNLYRIITGVWSLAILIPFLALGSRRLHDANLSAWLLLLYLIPIVGWIAMLVIFALPSKPEGVKYDEVQPQYPVEYQTTQVTEVEEPYQRGL